MKLWQRVQDFLNTHQGVFTYADLAMNLGSHPRAVGRAMYALGQRGFNGLCARVIHT